MEEICSDIMSLSAKPDQEKLLQMTQNKRVPALQLVLKIIVDTSCKLREVWNMYIFHSTYMHLKCVFSHGLCVFHRLPMNNKLASSIKLLNSM